ncbi:MAG TPA: NAD(P)/FAD-dependent oxidoreductase [Candidatus Dormibacteraeota bacterium]|jgi:2-polyprenyl-6-methoxyphenol hydroxylase-like FAD-dependent oxidoreductase|nr:NAD(P)/FAD-dependent oxidoreductase [Candidatus Dormibacteraeota bacterium]
MSEAGAVVVGAGPSGAATALVLSRAGHPVTVLDRARFPRDKACGEGLMPPGVGVLRRLGLLDDVLATSAPSIRGVLYTHGGDSPRAYAPFPPPRHGGERWGLGVRRTVFDSVLVDALRQAPRVTLLEGVRASGIVRDGSGLVTGVTTDRGPVLGRAVVAADGLHSTVRAAAGLTRPARGGGRYGLAGHWRVDLGGLDRITVTFAEEQEWYQAPVGTELLLVSTLGPRSRIGVTARDYEAAARAALPELRTAELAVPPLAAGQFRQRPGSVAHAGLFLVGDAAGYDDPTTGEGIGIGLLLAERLGLHLAAQLSGELDRSTAEARYRRDHAQLWRDRSRVTALALVMARRPWLSRRAVARAGARPQALRALLGINCGYWGFGRLTPRDWASLAGF